jgi:hypothetical protein
VKAPAELQRAFAAVTGAPSPEQWARQKAHERWVYEVAADCWRESGRDLEQAARLAVDVTSDEGEYREICWALKELADWSEGSD